MSAAALLAALAAGLVPAAADAPVAPEPRVEIAAAPEPLRIGDPVTLRVTLPEGAGALEAPPVSDPASLAPFHLVAAGLAPDGALEIRVAPMDTGPLVLPPLEISWRDPSGIAGTLRTPPVPIEVSPLIRPEEADTLDIADLKPPAAIRADWLRLWPWAAGAAALLALLAAAALLLRKAGRRGAAVPGLDPLGGEDPWAWARAALERLRASGRVERGEVEEFHEELSDILRRYLEGRYRIAAPERTTFEIGEEMRRARIDTPLRRETLSLLSRCDQVKFAAARPSTQACREALAAALGLVDRSRPAREAPGAAAAADGGAG